MVTYLDPEDLKCGLVQTHNPLTADTPQADVENGVYNLYRWNASDGTYTLITNRIPLNPDAAVSNGRRAIQVAGASADCSRIFFHSHKTTRSFKVRAVSTNGTTASCATPRCGPTAASRRATYGTEDVRRRQIGEVRTPSPTKAASSSQATSNQGADASKQAVFVRKGPDRSRRRLPADQRPDPRRASYEGGLPRRRHVFFLANYGHRRHLEQRPTGDRGMPQHQIVISDKACDLYDYEVDTGELKDISATRTQPTSKER